MKLHPGYPTLKINTLNSCLFSHYLTPFSHHCGLKMCDITMNITVGYAFTSNLLGINMIGVSWGLFRSWGYNLFALPHNNRDIKY